MTRAAACRLCWLGGCQSGRWETGPARVCLPCTCELSQAAVADPEEMRGGIGIQRTWSRPPDWLLPQAPRLLSQGFHQLCSHSRPGGNSRALAPEVAAICGLRTVRGRTLVQVEANRPLHQQLAQAEERYYTLLARRLELA